ncbi:dihydrolipoamide acetyltransferase family protein [Cohnella faecalis]|uniref:Dihydrolipoamide acetyltransferase component of pyruvate dehydrogenase complex n=1 Tax=Cohnella faecalis TaxID=2315694 RepID=A0A398CVK5_9BACL|nr:dihydrolipoamide acetyltransferase family protein [Cohnella faecalis]RIE04568.1 2-oxo acid dehydrogenase subunit E2 [Cohnella faecalis]
MAKVIQEIIMPQLAESLVSATIDKWLKQPGDSVDMYEPICELITDKVNAELPSTVRGTLVKILAGNGETIEVGKPIALVETEASADASAGAGASNEAAASVPGAASSGALSATAAASTAAASVRPGTAASPPPAFDPNAPMRGRFSPAVQRLASEHGIDLARLPGSGMGGRITRKDVLDAAANGLPVAAPAAPAQPAASAAVVASPPPLPSIEVEGTNSPDREYYIDVTPIRNTIAKNMRQSVNEIPHAWTMVEVDLTNLVQLRTKLKDEFKREEGINLTYMPFLLKAVVGALKEFPIMNSVWAVDKIIVKRDINLSLAVGTEGSVLTPVIRHADQKNIVGLAHEINDLARRTREGKLKLGDLQGGTFTVNNTGTFGSVLSYPIINYPQAAILTFESIVKRPVVIGDMIGIRSMVNLCLSFDHRILDGVICGKFHQRIKENLESYDADTKLY